jgi:hypothetical protein
MSVPEPVSPDISAQGQRYPRYDEAGVQNSVHRPSRGTHRRPLLARDDSPSRYPIFTVAGPRRPGRSRSPRRPLSRSPPRCRREPRYWHRTPVREWNQPESATRVSRSPSAMDVEPPATGDSPSSATDYSRLLLPGARQWPASGDSRSPSRSPATGASRLPPLGNIQSPAAEVRQSVAGSGCNRLARDFAGLALVDEDNHPTPYMEVSSSIQSSTAHSDRSGSASPDVNGSSSRERYQPLLDTAFSLPLT